MKTMHTFEEVSAMIKSGAKLLLAGDESQLKKLPKGNWIGGTIPYFMNKDGGKVTHDAIQVQELPKSVEAINVKIYDRHSLKNVYNDAPNNGWSQIIIPALSETHFAFALEGVSYPKFASSPLVGWVSGIHLKDLGKVTPKAYDGTTGRMIENGAVVMHITLPAHKLADVGTVNPFEQGNGDVVTFDEDAFHAVHCNVNGERVKLADYVKRTGFDQKLPFVADKFGMKFNAAFQAIDEKTGAVSFYAPVFKGIEYRQAKPMGDYVKEFERLTQNIDSAKTAFACNCVLNFLYLSLEGKPTSVGGPATFGEIAYQLLNQTMVHLTVIDR